MAAQGASPYVASPMSAQRRSSRRSWFETPTATKLEIAVEKSSPVTTKDSRFKRRSIDEVETLVLTHFTKPPRIGFGKIVIGRSKTRILLVQNPAEYEQEVVVERFPYKKHFNIDHTSFVVEAKEVVSLTLTWTPQDAGNCREMILFHINDVYRLQAYVFGSADNPKPARKPRHGGLMGRRQALPSVVQTKSLKNIQDSYSARRSEELRDLRAQVKPIRTVQADQENVQPADLEDVLLQTPPPLESTAICKNDECNSQNALERYKSGFLSKMSPIPRVIDTANGVTMESYVSTVTQAHTPILNSKEEERSPLRTVSGNRNETRVSDSPHKHGSSDSGSRKGGYSGQGKQADDLRRIKQPDPETYNIKGEEAWRKEADCQGKPTLPELRQHVSPCSFLNDSMAGKTAATTPEVGCIKLAGQVTRIADAATVSPNSFLQDMGRGRPSTIVEGKASIPSPSAVLDDSIPHDIMVQHLEFVRKSLHDASGTSMSTPKLAALPARGKQASKQAPKGKKIDRVSELSQQHSQQGRKMKVDRVTELSQPQERKMVTDRDSRLSQPQGKKMGSGEPPQKRNIFASAHQQQNGPGKKEKFMQRKIQENARFAKITEAPSPRRKTFLVRKQRAGKVSPVKGQLRSTKGRKNTREVAADQSAQSSQPTQHTEIAGDPYSSCGQPAATDTEQKEGTEGVCTNNDDSNLDDTITRRRRSLWASPAMVAFRPCIVTVSTDSESEELQKLENGKGLVSLDEADSQSCRQLVQSPSSVEKPGGPLIVSNQESKDNGCRGSGRRLFPDVISEDLNLSSDFRPLWTNGSSTVTKDQPSISLQSASGNTSKKLFPDISAEGQPLSELREEEKDVKYQSTACPAGRGTQEKSWPSFELSSTPQLLSSPRNRDEVTRRSTLTVTKSRPSLALLQSSTNQVTQACTIRDTHCTHCLPAGTRACTAQDDDEEEVWHTETVVIETRNSAIINVSMSRDCFTPSHPSSPLKSKNSCPSPLANNKNSVVLSRDGSTPGALFSAASDGNAVVTSTQEDITLAETTTTSMSQQVGRERKQLGNGQKEVTASGADWNTALASDFTERVEHHQQVERHQVVKPRSAFPAQEVVHDNSAESLEISRDSLELGLKNSSAGTQDDDNSNTIGDDDGDDSKSGIDGNTIDRGSNTGNDNDGDCKGEDSDDRKDDTHNCSSGDPKAKETAARPVLPLVVKETLLKHSASSDTDQITNSTPCTVSNHNRPPSSLQSQGQIRRSLSAEFRSKTVHPPQACKPPVAFTFKETKALNQKAKPAMTSQPKGRTVVRSSSQSMLECRKQPERLNRKRSSPEAGLKESRSKRVELDTRATEGKSQQPQSRTKGRPAAERAAKATRGVPLAKLILVKKSKTAMPKHPLPFAAKNMYYDERWQDKQERGFVHWLNFVLTPADEYMLATTKTKVDARSIAFDGSAHKVAPRLAPSKEVLSFRAYGARRRLNHLRRASCRLFQTEGVARVVCRLELEVEQRRLAVRTDRMIHADIGIKQKILDMLLSYNPLWLRIGLETVYGEVLPIQSNSDVIGMSRFILTRLLTSPDISAHFSHPTVPHCYHDGYADAIAQHTMKKFLVLVYFLDRAKQSRLINHDPCLFCKDAEIKSSKAMLVQFSRDFLSGEGDITKHLAYMGYLVSHAQTPLDEFDYAVTNLCVDLRDGLRLGRIIMLLSGDWGFASSLRAPAISRLQKIHNLELVFKQLAQRGMDFSTAKGGTLSARDIVDGHREKTLAFLWKLIFHFQTVAMLNEQELQEEVEMLERTLRVKLCMQRLLGRPSHALSEPMARRDSGGISLPMDSPMTQLLLKWCRTVCLHYGIKVENFTVSFSDGRALCCLVHHYHPSLLPLSAINFYTSQSLQEDAQLAQEATGDEEEELSQDWGTNQFGGEVDQSLFHKLLANEKENFKILYEKVSELGGIPLMLKAGDMINTIPDERVVLTYLSYLCTRLLDLREETRAARILQLAWRRFCLRRSARLRKAQTSACLVIQRAWRQYWDAVKMQRQQKAAIRLQAAWRGHRVRAQVALLRQAERDCELHRAASAIQTSVRCFLARQRHRRGVRSAAAIQTWWRARRARARFQTLRAAASTLQRRWRAARSRRAAVLRERQRREAAAAQIQARYRRHLAARQARALRQAALRHGSAAKIQAVFRAYSARRRTARAQREGAAATAIQAFVRGAQQRRRYLAARRSVVCLQTHARGFLARRELRELKRALGRLLDYQQTHERFQAVVAELHRRWRSATILQAAWRGRVERQRYRVVKTGVTRIQAVWRGHAERQRYQVNKTGVTRIQASWRGHAQRQRYQVIKTGVTRIQAAWRGHAQRQRYQVIKTGVTRIQATWRGHVERQRYQIIKTGVTRIQAAWRGHAQRQRYQVIKTGVTRLQAVWRGHVERQRYQIIKTGVTRIQAAWRGLAQRQRYQVIKTGVTRIQAAWRGHAQRQRYQVIKTGVKRIQAAWRGHAQRQRYQVIKTGVTRIQAAWRGHTQRQRYQVIKTGVTRIQAAWRGHAQRQRYQVIKTGVTRIQAAWRGHAQRQRYQVIKTGVTRIQAVWRGHAERQRYQVNKTGVTRIQAAWRGHAQRQRYQVIKTGVTRIQAAWRGHAQRQRYQVIKTGVTRIQAAWRGHVERQRYQIIKTGVTRIQAAWRGHAQRQRYQVIKTGVTRLQAVWRGHVERQRYQIIKTGVTRIQAAWRGLAQRQRYQVIKTGVTRIQAAWRGHAQRQRYQVIKTGVTRIQAAWRGHAHRQRYQVIKTGVTRIQAAWRGHVERQRYQIFKTEVTRIQAAWRGHAQRQRYQVIKTGVTRLQAVWRGHVERQRYQIIKTGVTRIQAAWRGLAQRQRYQVIKTGVTRIQAAWRGHAQRQRYQVIKTGVTRIQAVWRGHAERQCYQVVKTGVTRIQAAWRGHTQRQRYQVIKTGVTRIQAAWRGHAQRQRYQVIKTGVTRIQAAWRGHAQRQRYQVIKTGVTRIQAAWRGHAQRQRYQVIKTGVTRIQAVWRGHAERQRYQVIKTGVTRIQAVWRGHAQRQRYQVIKTGVTRIQAVWRGHAERQRYQVVKTGVTRIQAAWRGHAQRQRFLAVKKGVVQLQAKVRGQIARKRFLHLVRSVTAVQRLFRARRRGQAARLRYQLMVGAAILIQCTWKAHKVRSYFLRLRAHVITAQAHCRRYLARSRFQEQRQAAVCLQRRFRARLAGREALKEYRHSRRAVTGLQARVRGLQQRRRFLRTRQACVTIQARVRRHLAEKQLRALHRAAVVLQQRWRARAECRRQAEDYAAARKAAVTIQSRVRGHLARRRVARLHQAATVIQREYRRHAAGRRFARMRQAAITVQTRVRAFLHGRQQQARYASARRACITIQAAYRRFVAQRRYVKMRQSAVRIQAAFRSCIARRRFWMTRQSIVVIQTAYRRYAARHRFLEMKYSAVTVQAAYRSFVARQHYLRMRRSAVRLQAAVRGFLQRRRYVALLTAAMRCQARYRAKCLARVFRAAFLMIRDAAIVIQKHHRGRTAREACRRRHQATLTLQAGARGWLVRQRLARETTASVCIQRWWRANRCAVQARTELFTAKRAAVSIQQWWRERREARRQASAVVIQARIRGFLARRKFLSDVQRLVRFQACVRGFLSRRQAANGKSAICSIQRRWRETLMMRGCRHEFLVKREAAVAIQAWFRGHRARLYFITAVRRVSLLQGAVRGWLQRRRYRKLRAAVVSIQRRARSNAVCRRQRRLYLAQQKSAARIQRAFRAWQERKRKRQENAATCLQSYARMLPIRRDFLRARKAAVTLQAAFRGLVARRALREKRRALVCIQRGVRFFLLLRRLRHQVHARRVAAVKIQRSVREHLARRESRRREAAAVCLQRHYRALVTRRQEQVRLAERMKYLQHYADVARRHFAVVMIQRWYWRCIVVRQARKQECFVVLIQRRIRAFLQRVWYLRAVQAMHEEEARRERAALLIQSAFRRWQDRQREKRRLKQITLIQALWRGRKVRRSLTSRKIAAARRRVQEANNKATEEKTLGNRTASALDFLLHYKQLSYILDALIHLDVATRLSWECCERLVEVNAVSVIYRLILSCNRSVPHMELIKFSVSILLNLAKYDKTTQAVYEAEGALGTLLDLMSVYRDNSTAIFTKTCMLLAVLGSDAHRKTEMCSDRHLVDKLQSVHVLVLRKHRMRVARARVASCSSLNATLPSRLHGPKSVKVRPAWVLRRDSMYDIEDPLAALSFLMDTLHIGPKMR